MLESIRGHPLRAVWIVAQLTVVGWAEYLTIFKGADYHLGFVVLPIMGLLLFPGVLVPYGVLFVGFSFYTAVAGTSLILASPWTTIITLSTWASSAYLTDAFWRRVSDRWRDAAQDA